MGGVGWGGVIGTRWDRVCNSSCPPSLPPMCTECRPAVPKPYKQHRQDAIVYEDVTFPHSAVDRMATSDSGIYEVVQPAPPSLSRGRGLHSSSSSNDEGMYSFSTTRVG